MIGRRVQDPGATSAHAIEGAVNDARLLGVHRKMLERMVKVDATSDDAEADDH